MLQKKSAPLNFAGGLDTKSDSKQVPFGKFLVLENSVFSTTGLLRKRNGYGALSALPDATTTDLTTFNGNLTAIGTTLSAYADGPKTWTNKGPIRPLNLSVLPTVRSAVSQTQCDSVIGGNGLVCTVYTEVNAGVSAYKYIVADSATGQNIIAPTAIPVASGVVTGGVRVFALGGYFIVVFTNVIATVSHLQYIAISQSSPSTVTANTDIAAAYISASALSWDGVVYGTNLYLAYNTTSGGQQIKIASLTSSLVLNAATSFAGQIATMMSLCVDDFSPSNPIIYAAYYDSGGSTGHVFAVDATLGKRMAPTQVIASGTYYNITCTAYNGSQTVLAEKATQYSYNSALVSNNLSRVVVTLPATVTTGTVGSLTTPIRSVGLASKAFLIDGTTYVLTEYASLLQSTYFLIDDSGHIISRFAYENGGASLVNSAGYLPTGLPQAQVMGSAVHIAYLFKDLIQSQSTLGLAQSIGPAGQTNIYSQTGVNLISIDFSSDTLSTAEIGGTLALSGGMLWTYDGQTVNEQGFHVFPDNVATATNSDPSPTGTVTSGSAVITAVSSVANITIGMVVTDVTNAGAIPANTTVIAVGTTTITMSNNALGSHAADTLLFVGALSPQAYYYQVVYEWTDAVGSVINSAPSVPVTTSASLNHTSMSVFIPTLRLSYKTGVKISIYRWSTAQEIYYLVTSISSPLLNDPTVDSIVYIDISSDAQILGNRIIYTAGGVLENLPGPACTATALFDDRLWEINAEDQNLLSYSKQVIESTPIEMSDNLTIYVAPSTGAQGSTGFMKCLFPMDDKLIIFKPNAAYYINGSGPDNTGSNSQYSQPTFITSSVGCSNQRSIVLIPQGLMFQSNKGIWLLGRDLSTSYIGADVEAYNSFTVNSAVSVPGTTQVRFTLSNGKTLMYDYFYNQWGTFSGVPAISSTLYQDLHTYVNSSGIVSQETPGLYLDNGNPVLLKFTTSWLNLTGLQGYQRAYFFYILGQYITPHKLQLGIAYDYNPSFITAPIISPTNFTPAYGDVGPYGEGSPYGGPGDLENWRVFMKKQRCQAFQITLQEVYDSTLGVAAGAGLTLSGLNIIYGSKSSFRPIPAAKSVG